MTDPQTTAGTVGRTASATAAGWAGPSGIFDPNPDVPTGTVRHDPDSGDVWVRVAGLIDPWLVVMPGGDTFTTARIPGGHFTELVPAQPAPPAGRRGGLNGTGVPCTIADVGPRVGERLEIHVWQSITDGKVDIIIGYLDRLDGHVAVVSPLWSAAEVRINVCDIAGIWSAEPR